MRTGIVLVGGEARRAGGVEKYFFEVCGQTFIDRLLQTLRGVVDEIVIVARSEEQCARFAEYQDVRCIEDLRKGLGPIGGVHAGALAAHGDELFVVACDMPCINGMVIEALFGMMAGYDAAIPCWNREMLEPLHAVYRRTPLLEYLRDHKSRSLRAMVEGLHPRYVPAELFRPMDPDLLTFININHISDLERFKAEIEHRL
ncbi:molybdenum cofactor guanylyltransferase [Methanofollis formosanus]|uniref:Molybdenum cofactor guanylyltransferase n=1 Tax=Methanofollis formosanus TaxID=299308 RepID=A0A8G1A424_9EURY|nr:molybdenum cofactor guanylyltransferase [Methanofollis formosanus]QYZ80043.1 molybdenum cofactor guanylyltransferase [Methanofollis formosanus]